MRPSREIHLAARPQGMPDTGDFVLVEVGVPEPADGEVLIQNAYISVDPYMRGRMNDAKSYVPPFALGEVMTGGAVGRVVASQNDRFREGAWVVHNLGWREFALSDGKGLLPFDTTAAPASTGLGVLGMPGLTAYVGLLDVGRVEAGETVYVSGAAGAVGSAVGQIAKLKGCRVIGSAGSAEKVAWLKEIGFDEAFDYHDVPAREALGEGIDVYFDNVGGSTLEAALAALRLRGRIVACGAISQYNATEPPVAPRNLFLVVTKRLRMEGFIVSDHFDRMAAFLNEVAPHVRDCSLRYRETVVDGIQNAPAAFIGLLMGENIGKMLVRVGPDDA
ncbi:MAG: NADP-dependent oxidoreductase [Thermoleophilia bacterium]|nr:NADP-dependent oxidoreductase [Thermoleophilia bacterium]